MQEIQFDYFRGMEAEQYSFYRVPKVLFTAECFKSLSCEAKVLYGLMLDRMSLSIKNRWFDEEDRVYIIFTVEEIAELLNCGSQKAVKLMKELDSNHGIGLIEKKRLGLGKPNVIYVKNFMLKEKHSFEQEEKAAGNAENMQNSENHNSRIVKTTNQEFPESQFKNGENHTSRIVKIKTQEVPKSQSNNTDINKTDYTETDPIQSYLFRSAAEECLVSGDMMEKMEVYREILRTNVDYAGFVQKGEREDVDELIELMVEILMLPDDSMVRIGGADKPVSVVKSRFLKLTYSHIEYVLFSLHRNTSKVANIKAYLLTTLYNSSMTMNHYYQAEVNHDLYGGG
jgi:Replication initiator protein A (RepA) N-terminus.